MTDNTQMDIPRHRKHKRRDYVAPDAPLTRDDLDKALHSLTANHEPITAIVAPADLNEYLHILDDAACHVSEIRLTIQPPRRPDLEAIAAEMEAEFEAMEAMEDEIPDNEYKVAKRSPPVKPRINPIAPATQKISRIRGASILILVGDKWVTAKDAASLLGISQSAIYTRVKHGRLRGKGV